MRRAILLLLLTAACVTSAVAWPPRTIENLPWSSSPADRVALQARDLADRGDVPGALARLREVLAQEPRHADALRLRQDLLRQRGRRGLLLHEVETALADDPDDALVHYLHGRLVGPAKEKLRWFRRAAELAPASVWPWLGLAHTLRDDDPRAALQTYERLYDATGQHPLVGIAFAAALREQDRAAEAGRVYDAMISDPRVPGVGHLGRAHVALAEEDRAAAWSSLIEALRLRPFDPGVQALAHGWIEAQSSSEQESQLLDVLREDPERWAAFGRGSGAVVFAELLRRRGLTQAARGVLERRVAVAPTPQLRRELRRLLLVLGDVDGFLQRLAVDVPLHVVDHEANEVRGRWLALLRGPWIGGRALATREQSAMLLTALRDAGLLVEAEQLADVVLQRWPGTAEVVAVRDEVRRELAFEAGLRRLLYQGYQARSTADLSVVVAHLRILSQRVFGKDVVGSPAAFTAPLVGDLLDPFTGELATHLARYNRHLVLGRRAGGTCEGLLLTRLSVQELPPMAELPLPGRCMEVVGFDRDVRALAGMIGGDLAGVALLNHFLIDFDAVRDWADSLLLRRRVAREDGMALLTDPLPVSAGDDPLDVSWRLTLKSPVPDSELEAAVLDMIRHHERQHLVDSFHFLPLEANVWRGLGLLLRFGLSPARIEAEMERRAELAALAVSPHTELVLAHIADFMAEPGVASPHHHGFGELGRQLSAALRAAGAGDDATPSRWHRVPRAMVQQAAAGLLRRVR
jgi:tetratricopeptide (TPR) repeat protein